MRHLFSRPARASDRRRLEASSLALRDDGARIHESNEGPDSWCNCSCCGGVWGFDVEPTSFRGEGSRWSFPAAA